MLFLMMLFLAFNNELDALVQRRKPPLYVHGKSVSLWAKPL